MINFKPQPMIKKHSRFASEEYNCAFDSPAYRLCISQSCVNPSICCQDDQCECNKLHTECPQIRLRSLVDKLNSKIIDYSSILQKVNELFDNLIDQVSQILQQSQKCIKRYGLRRAQIRFLDCMQDSHGHKLTGKIVSAANKLASVPYDGDFALIVPNIESLWNDIGHVMLTPLFSIKDVIEIPTIVNRLDPKAGDQFRKQIVSQMTGKNRENLQNLQGSFIKNQLQKQDNQIFEEDNRKQKEKPILSDAVLEKNQDRILSEKLSLKRSSLQLMDKGFQNDPFAGKVQRRSLQLQNLIKPKEQPEKSRIQRRIEFGDKVQKNISQDKISQKRPNTFSQLFGFGQKNQMKQEVHLIKLGYEDDSAVYQDQIPKERQQQNKAKVEQQQKKNINLREPQKQQIVNNVNNPLSREYLIETGRYLCEILGISAPKCIEFINGNCYKEGVLLNKEQILDLALQSSTLMNE